MPFFWGALDFHTCSIWVHSRGTNYEFGLQNIHRATWYSFSWQCRYIMESYTMHDEILDPNVNLQKRHTYIGDYIRLGGLNLLEIIIQHLHISSGLRMLYVLSSFIINPTP